MQSRAGHELFFMYILPGSDSSLGNVPSMTHFARGRSGFVVKDLNSFRRFSECVAS